LASAAGGFLGARIAKPLRGGGGGIENLGVNGAAVVGKS